MHVDQSAGRTTHGAAAATDARSAAKDPSSLKPSAALSDREFNPYLMSDALTSSRPLPGLFSEYLRSELETTSYSKQIHEAFERDDKQALNDLRARLCLTLKTSPDHGPNSVALLNHLGKLHAKAQPSKFHDHEQGVIYQALMDSRRSVRFMTKGFADRQMQKIADAEAREAA